MARLTSLRTRLLRQFLLLGVLPVMIVSAAAIALTHPVLTAQAEARNRDLAFAVRDQMRLELVLRLRTASLLAEQLRQGTLPAQGVAPALRSLVAGDRYVQAAYVTDERGIIAAAALQDQGERFASDVVGADLSAQPYYRQARGDGGPTWSDTFLSTLTGRITAVLTVPAGVRSVVIEFALDGLSSTLSDLSKGSDVTVVVLDRHGSVIAHPDTKPALRQESMVLPPATRDPAPDAASRGPLHLQGVDYLALTLPLTSVGWSILAAQPVDAVLAPIRRLGAIHALLWILTVLLAAVASWLYARQTGSEVARLADAAQAAATPGDQASGLRFTTTEFNQVWLRIKELFQQLHARERDTRTAQGDLQAVLDAATEVAIIATDTEGRVTVFNIGAQRMLQRSAASVVGRLTPLDWHDTHELQAREGELRRKYGKVLEPFEVLAIEARHGGYEIRDWTYLRADGQRLSVSLAVTSLRSAEGDLKGFLGVAVDVTERRRAAELELSRRSAELANQAKSDFLSRVSHELRSPLNAMLGFAQLIDIDRADPPSPVQRERVRQIQRAGWHLVQLIDDVLDLSRIESGQLRVSIGHVELAGVIEHALDLSHAELERAGIVPELIWSGGAAGTTVLPVQVLADETRLTQVLVNLLGNAAKYNRPGGTITLDCALDDDAVTLQVRDSGRGMSAEQRARLFQPFDRLGMESSGIEGTGIGLVITRRLLELMSGSIEVRSEPGVGSTFTVRLLRAAVEAPPLVAEAPIAAQAALQAAPDGAATDALYIEDNEVNAQLMRAVMRHRPQVRLHVATTIRAGLDWAAAHHPSLILLDMHLPDGNGHDALDALAADQALCQVPVIVVSADATRRQVAEVSSRVHAYVTKPIDVMETLGAIDEALRSRGTRPRGSA